MKNKFGRRQTGNMAAKPTMIIHGDAQAEAVALILRRLPQIVAAHDVVYSDSRTPAAVGKETLTACSHVFEQHGAQRTPFPNLARNCKRITFPSLRLKLLWPLAAPNPYNCPEPGNPVGRFPVGDSFIAACLDRGVPADEIMQYYQAPVWSGTWPNLDALFSEESARLSSIDAKCDVKIGSFVLKNFRKERLFWAIEAPTNRLLSELVYRLLHAAFGPLPEYAREHVESAVSSVGPRDVMGRFAIPLHPLVARHFNLQWFDASERYAVFEEYVSFAEYYNGMIQYAAKQMSLNDRSAQRPAVR